MGIVAATRGIHDVELGEPEEEFAILEESFAAWTYLMRFRVPDYARWLGSPGGGRGLGLAYRLHRQTLQHLSWQRRKRQGAQANPRQWLLKMPFHLAELPILAQTYPDAVFIQTHRTPREFLPSWLSLAESLRGLCADEQGAPSHKAELGEE